MGVDLQNGDMCTHSCVCVCMCVGGSTHAMQRTLARIWKAWGPVQALPLTPGVTIGKALPLSDFSLLSCKMEGLGNRNTTQATYVIVSFPITTLRKVFKGEINFNNIFIESNIAQMLFQHVINITYSTFFLKLFSKCSVYFTLTAHINSKKPHFECSVTMRVSGHEAMSAPNAQTEFYSPSL